jgi:hypothetical protein
LSDLRAGHALPPGIFLVLTSVTGQINPEAIVWLEGLGKLSFEVAVHKKKQTS